MTSRWLLGILAVCALFLGLGAPGGAASAARARLTAGTSLPKCTGSTAAGSVVLALVFRGKPRTVIVHLPTGYTGKTKVPLVLNLHGSGSTAAAQEVFSGMDAEADVAGFIVAYPQAAIRSGSGFDWNIPGVPLGFGEAKPAHPPEDLTFLTELVEFLETQYCINRSAVYATGFSGGARMASLLACDDSNIFAAVAPVSGLRLPSPCPAVRAVPVISFHGTADRIDPYRGNGQPYWTYSVPRAARDWALQDRCLQRPRTSRPADGVALTAYGHCANDAQVELYTIAGEGHEWPGGPSLPHSVTKALGPQSDAVNANVLIWSFFSRHTL